MLHTQYGERKMRNRKRCWSILKVILGTAFLLNSICTFATIRGLGTTGNPCAPGGLGVRDDGLNHSCVYDEGTSEKNATVLWGAGQVWSRASTIGTYTMPGVYPPFTGIYQIKQYFCPSTQRAICLMKNATTALFSIGSEQLSSNVTVANSNVDFKGFTGTVSQSSNACFTLVDEKGFEWGAPDPVMCQDTPNILPDTPADCYLNGNSDMNIDMGSLERSKLDTMPASGSPGNIKKNFPVLCTRDAGSTVLTTLQFTPLTVSGKEVVSTSTANLGIAIFYNGKLIGPSSTPVNETFATGYTERVLEFQAIRNPDAVLKDISTGAFTASAIMVMTVQ